MTPKTLTALLLSLCLVLTPATAEARAKQRPVSLDQLESSVARIRSGKNADKRAQAAKQLATLTQTASSEPTPAQIPPQLVTDIASLLDSPEDSVQFWVATALGNIGPAAKPAIPKLLEVLPTATCRRGAITSASGIRYALVRLGEQAPPQPRCSSISG